ncbi:MAG TPA: peptidase M20, partial [Rhodanobacteraceae bacterium]|nr:peptidase M20 [Rhodanobacteraceae bacterium]
MKWLMIPALALTLSVSACAANQNSDADAKTAKATYAPTFDAARLSDEVKTLSSDAFEGRGPATVGETKTIDYVVAQMKAAGLEPGGDLVDGKRSWTQDVPLARFQISGTPAIDLDVDGRP